MGQGPYLRKEEIRRWVEQTTDSELWRRTKSKVPDDKELKDVWAIKFNSSRPGLAGLEFLRVRSELPGAHFYISKTKNRNKTLLILENFTHKTRESSIMKLSSFQQLSTFSIIFASVSNYTPDPKHILTNTHSHSAIFLFSWSVLK